MTGSESTRIEEECKKVAEENSKLKVTALVDQGPPPYGVTPCPPLPLNLLTHAPKFANYSVCHVQHRRRSCRTGVVARS